MDLDAFKKNGYLILKNFLPKESVENVYTEARTVFYRQFREKGLTKAEMLQLRESEFNACMYDLFATHPDCFMNCGKQVQHLISLHQLALSDKIVKLLGELGLQTPNISTRPVLYFNHPKLARKKVYHTVDAHQDWRSMQGSLNSVVIWVPLTDITEELGALQVVPGSHLWGLKTDHIDTGFGMVDLSEKERSGFISVPLQRGDVLAFSAFTIHQSGENSSDAPRWSCHFRYNDLAEPTFVKRGYPHAYIYKPVDDLITPDFPQLKDVLKTFE